MKDFMYYLLYSDTKLANYTLYFITFIGFIIFVIIKEKMKDTKKCKYCYSEINKKATICPHCKKKQT